MENMNRKFFFEMAKGMESEPEGGKRCEACYRLRLFETAKKAKELGFEFFATTLTISPLKSADVLNRIGKEAEKATGVIYIESDFKKKGGYARSIELSREYGLYRQNFCGCVFSKRQEINETTQKY
jgi:predicted adenine nucleotide alpha hydrolase (AANH) superfamily ATPase